MCANTLRHRRSSTKCRIWNSTQLELNVVHLTTRRRLQYGKPGEANMSKAEAETLDFCFTSTQN